MNKRWTIKELKEKSDNEIVFRIICEKQRKLDSCMPLYKRLQEILDRIADKSSDNYARIMNANRWKRK